MIEAWGKSYLGTDIETNVQYYEAWEFVNSYGGNYKK